jgi:hypothetical protein
MVDKLINLNNPRVNKLLSGLITIARYIPQTCRSIKKYYLEYFPDDEDGLISWSDCTDAVDSIVSIYFEMKNDTLQFKKDCFSSKIFKGNCSTNVLGRIKEFVNKIKEALNLNNNPNNPIPKSFKLSDIDSRVNLASIKSALDALTPEQKSDSDVQALISMCTTTQEDADEKEARNEYAVKDFERKRREGLNPVTAGGRLSRYRRRPTKKYFKSRHRQHSSPKKKRHMKTKRHMKRHMKTKRHTKRH